jgi:hypothetical protein
MKNCNTIRVGGRVVGTVKNNAFSKRVSASRHFLHTPQAICLDVASLAQAELLGATAVEVTDKESGCVYRASTKQIHDHGFTLDRGYGEQIGLVLNRWQQHHPGAPLQLELGLAA